MIQGKENRKRNLVIHITGGFFFLASVFIFSPELSLSGDMFRSTYLWREFTGYVFILCSFYLNYFLLLPKLYDRKKYTLYLLCILVCFSVVSSLPHVLFPWHPSFLPDLSPPNEVLMHIGHNFFVFLMMVFVSFTLNINKRLKQTLKEKLDVEISYLKAQVNPHFLFNSLNSIYSLALERSEKTADAVVRLSHLMRYVLTESNRDRVPLEKEINYISDYIQLQQIRLGETIPIRYALSGEFNPYTIAPLLLIPFVENAFKHGVTTGPDAEIQIAISVYGHLLNLTVNNPKAEDADGLEDRTGTGFENIRNRLTLLYPGKHELRIEDSHLFFIVYLRLDLS